MKNNQISVQGTSVSIKQQDKNDYISLTDIARYKDAERSDYILQNWMRTKDTIEFLGLWEKINNDDFNPVEFDGIRNRAGVNSFTMSPHKLIKIGFSQSQRLVTLNETAISQMTSLLKNSAVKTLK